jgi:hypothetical protein
MSSLKMRARFEVRLGERVVVLASEDRDEFLPGLEEPASLTDRLIGAVEKRGSSTTAVCQLASAAVVINVVVSRNDRSGAFDRLDRFEVLLGDRFVGDPRVDERHARRAMAEERSDRWYLVTSVALGIRG